MGFTAGKSESCKNVVLGVEMFPRLPQRRVFTARWFFCQHAPLSSIFKCAHFDLSWVFFQIKKKVWKRLTEKHHGFSSCFTLGEKSSSIWSKNVKRNTRFFSLWVYRMCYHIRLSSMRLNRAAFRMILKLMYPSAEWSSKDSEAGREETCVKLKVWLGALSTVAATLAEDQPSLACFTVV